MYIWLYGLYRQLEDHKLRATITSTARRQITSPADEYNTHTYAPRARLRVQRVVCVTQFEAARHTTVSGAISCGKSFSTFFVFVFFCVARSLHPRCALRILPRGFVDPSVCHAKRFAGACSWRCMCVCAR